MPNTVTAELNFDCLVGPTHHFGGLSLGNLASTTNKMRPSNPKAAALQGLEKMRGLHTRGLIQGVLPPHPRPHGPTLRTLGFVGTDAQMIAAALKTHPAFLKLVCSSSAMWAANTATISPSHDCSDERLHITPANLVTMFHRHIEAKTATHLLRQIFKDPVFAVHDPLPAHDLFSDEGAANHNRLAPSHAHPGLEIFVYGKTGLAATQKSRIFPSRQSLEACRAIARLHNLKPASFLAIEQNPDAIDAGAFHNDVVAVANESLFLCHEKAFVEQKQVLENIARHYHNLFEQAPHIIEISDRDFSLDDAVKTYLFNSQLVTKPSGTMLLLAPSECAHHARAQAVIKGLLAGDNPIDEVDYFNVCESMANGGGPACLRLRMVLSPAQLSCVPASVLFTESLYQKLKAIIERYYVNDFKFELLLDSHFLTQSSLALAEIYSALDLALP